MTLDPSLNINGYSFTSILTNSSKACIAALSSVFSASKDISITDTIYANFTFKSNLLKTYKKNNGLRVYGDAKCDGEPSNAFPLNPAYF